MARPLRIEYPDAFYHITARGNERQNIFRDDADRTHFLSYLENAVLRYKAVIHVYCLMNNHYHLLLSTPLGNLAQIMRHINGAYTVYFNKRHERYGHLFQGRYKAILIDADEYAGELSRYIHLNPLRAKLTDKVDEYNWSSYIYYIGKKKPPFWLETKWLLHYFGKRLVDAQKAYQRFVEAKIGVYEENPLKNAIASTILGRGEFIDKIREKYLKGIKKDRDIPALAELTKIEPGIILKAVEIELKDRSEYIRKAAIYLSHRYSGLSLKEIGREYGIGESAVSQTSRRFEQEMTSDKRLKSKVMKVIKSLKLCNV